MVLDEEEGSVFVVWKVCEFEEVIPEMDSDSISLNVGGGWREL